MVQLLLYKNVQRLKHRRILKFFELYNKVQNVGLTSTTKKLDAKIIRTHNGILFISGAMLSPFPFLFIYMGVIEGLLLCLFGFVIVTVPVWLNHLGLYVVSRVLSFAASVLIFVLGIFLFGYDAGFEYGILVVMVLPILYFRTTKSRIFAYILSIFPSLIFHYFFENPFIKDIAYNDILTLKTALFYACISLVIYYFFASDKINKEYQSENEQLVNSLLVKNKELKRFSYSVSHDLKEPLRTISSFTQLLKRDMGEQFSENSQEYYDFITKGTRQMSKLLDDVLHYSKFEQMKIEREDVDLNDILYDVIYQLSARLENVDTDIEIGNLPVVKGMRSLLLQLFLNLISNAVKFNKKGHPFTLKVWSDTDEFFHHIHVRDFGIGIDEAYQDKIFDIFKRLHRRFEYEGSGIGLATCLRIMERLDGKISVRSRLGEGATFTVSFPVSSTVPLSKLVIEKIAVA